MNWTYPGPALEQPIKMVFTQEDTFRNLIEGRLGLEISLDELNRFFNPLVIIRMLRIINSIHFSLLIL